VGPYLFGEGKTKENSCSSDPSACSSIVGAAANLGAVIDFSDAMDLCYGVCETLHGAVLPDARSSKREMKRAYFGTA